MIIWKHDRTAPLQIVMERILSEMINTALYSNGIVDPSQEMCGLEDAVWLSSFRVTKTTKLCNCGPFPASVVMV
jgi:hypothetical protein